MGSPEQQARRGLEAAEDKSRALVAHLGGRERLARLDIARGEQQIEQVPVLAIVVRLASQGDDLVDGREPRLLKRATLAGRKRECRFITCQHVQNIGVPWSFDV